MVSLRERKARPSYTNIPEGLENLTDSEEEQERAADRARASGSRLPGLSRAPSAIAGGSGTPGAADVPTSPTARSAKSVDLINAAFDDEDDSLSSGDSSEFELSDHGKKGKGRAKAPLPKRGGGGGSGSGSESDFGMAPEELMELDDDEDGLGPGEEEEDDEEGSIGSEGGGPSRQPRSKTTRGPRVPNPRVGRPKMPHGPAYVQTDLSLIPPAYRALIRVSAEAMVKPPPSRIWPHARPRHVDASGFPGGNVTPFITRLGPEGVESEVAGSKDERRTRAVKVERKLTVGVGEEAWEGEGWFREMYTGGGSEGASANAKGKAKANGKGRDEEARPGMEEWRLRGEVRMGLDEVGRVNLEEMEFVPAAEIIHYLPTAAADGTSTTVHIGRHDKQTGVEMRMFDHAATSQYDTMRDTLLFFAGGPIWGMDWCPLPAEQAIHYDGVQFLAITTLPDLDTKPAIGEKWLPETMSAIQIWSVDLPGPDETEAGTSKGEGEKGSMKCELVLCVEGGPGMVCKWMPMGAWDDCDPARLSAEAVPKIGILAVIQLDGSVSFYAVPHPLALRRLRAGGMDTDEGHQPLFLKYHQPLLRVDLVDTTATTMDWLTGSKLAVGYSNAVWDVADALRSGQRQDLLPHVYVSVAQSCIASIAAGRVPSSDANGEPMYDEDPRFIVVGSWDGTLNMLDLRDPGHPVVLHRIRAPYMTVAWSSQNQSPLSGDSDYNVFMMKIRGAPTQRQGTITPHRGSIWDIGTSDYHTMIASAGADGAVSIGSTQIGSYRQKKAPLYFWRLLEMDYDKVTGHYRLTDDFIPEMMSLDKSSGRKPKKKGLLAFNDASAMKAGNWDPRVAIHRVTWNEGSGIARAGMLAVGSASGLGQVQVINPRWRLGVDTSTIGQ